MIRHTGKNKKWVSRQRRAQQTRAKIRELNAVRLTVHKTLNHMYAQIISACGTRVLVAASTLEKTIRAEMDQTGNMAAAAAVGTLLAQRALEVGVKQVAFDRSGYPYHGRIKVLAEAAREAGMVF